MKTIMPPFHLSSRDVQEFYANGVGAVEGGSGGDGAGDWTNANDACGGRCFQRSTNPTNHPSNRGCSRYTFHCRRADRNQVIIYILQCFHSDFYLLSILSLSLGSRHNTHHLLLRNPPTSGGHK